MAEELNMEDKEGVTKVLGDQVNDLKTELEKKKQDEKAAQSKVAKIENDYKKKLDEAEQKAEQAVGQARDLSKDRDQV